MNTVLTRLIKKNEFVAFAICLLQILVLTFGSNVFWTGANWDSLQSSIAPTAIMAFGMMFLLICGYFDLSISSTMMMTGMLCGRLQELGLPVPAMVLLGLLGGLAVGCLNGFLVSYLRINPLIATIGTQFMVYGIAMMMWSKELIMTNYPPAFIAMGEGKLLGLYYMTWVLLLLLLLFSYCLRFTALGRQLYYVGGNRPAAKLMGFHDRRIIFWAYALTGALAAIAGMLAVARIKSPTQYVGEGVHMTCMIACVVGGGSFAGGKGSALGAVLGVAFMSLLTNMFNLLPVFKPQMQNVVVGLILIAVIVMDGYLTMKKMREMGKI